MGHGVDLDWYKTQELNSNGMSQSKAMHEMVKRLQRQHEYVVNGKIGYIILWSDAFQVNFVRTKTASTWILTAVLSPPRTSAKVSPFHTYVIAMGNKSWVDGRKEVLNTLFTEISVVRKGKWRYNGFTKRKDFVAMDVIAYNADRPERMDIIGTRDKGLIGNVFGYSMTVNRDKFPSCKSCKKKRQLKLLRWTKRKTQQIKKQKHTCLNCCDWNLEGVTKPFQGNFPKNFKYPQSVCSNSPPLPPLRKAGVKYLVPFRQDFDSLIMAVKGAYFNMANNYWKLSINSCGDVTNCVLGRNYLQMVGLNDRIIDEIIKEAGNAYTTKANLDPEHMDNLQCIPYIWKAHLPLSAFLNSPWHMLFLGILKTLMMVVCEVCVALKSCAMFVRTITTVLLATKKLNMSFCRLAKMEHNSTKGTLTSGWLSDNCVAFGRIMPIFIHVIFSVVLTAGKKDQLPKSFKCAFENMFSAFFVLIYLVMSHKELHSTVIEEHIKAFCSCCYKFERLRTKWNASITSQQQKEKRHFWNRTPNFLTLHRLPEQLQLFGHVSFANELIFERHISKVKPLTKTLRNTSSGMKIVMTKMQERRVLEILSAKQKAKSNKNCFWFNLDPTLKGNQFKVYSTRQEVVNELYLGHPLVVCRLHNGFDVRKVVKNKMFVLIGRKTKLDLFEIKTTNNKGKHIMILWYTVLKVNQYPTWQITLEAMKTQFKCSCLCMPLIGDKSEHIHYTIVCSSWEIFGSNKTFHLPRIHKSILL